MDNVHDTRGTGQAASILVGDYVVTECGVFAYDIVHNSALQPRKVLDFSDPVDVQQFAAHGESKRRVSELPPWLGRLADRQERMGKRLVAIGDENGVTATDPSFRGEGRITRKP